MKHSLRNAAAVAMLAAAMAFSQNAPVHRGPGAGQGMMGRFGADLNLTDAQTHLLQ